MPAHSKGFTLVELAIALMVIGLLIGGVLKGQELIENARVTSTMRQLSAYDTAAMIFRNTYAALPGDIKRPTRIPDCNSAACNMAGNQNGRVYAVNMTSSVYDDAHERFNFFYHLSKAGMITSVEGGDATQIDTAINDITTPEVDLFVPKVAMDMQYQPMPIYTVGHPVIPDGSYYTMTLTPVNAEKLDVKLDDGKPTAGDVQQHDCIMTVGADVVYDPSVDRCEFFIRTGF